MRDEQKTFLLRSAIDLVLLGAIIWGAVVGDAIVVTSGWGGLIVMQIQDLKTRSREADHVE